MQSPNTTAKQTQQDKDERLVLAFIPATKGNHPCLQDSVFKDTEGTLRGYYSGRAVAEYIQEFAKEGRGELKLMRMCEFDKLHDDSMRTEPEEITESDWDYALNVLPPMKWHQLLGVESFRMSEFYSGTITTIYAKCEGRYWKFMDDAYMDTHVVVDKVRKVMEVQAA